MSNYKVSRRYTSFEDQELLNQMIINPVSDEFIRKFIAKSYLFMVVALAITSFVAYFTATSGLIRYILSSNFTFFSLIFAEIAIVLWLSSKILKLSTAAALFGFILYSLLNGVTLSVIFAVYTNASIYTAFLITAGMFLIMSIIGYTTKTNLISFGGYLAIALVGLIIASIVNLFLRSTSLYWIISAAGVLIFTIMIAYSAQKLKIIASIASFEQNSTSYAVLAALELYLNFINLLLYVLRFLGKRR